MTQRLYVTVYPSNDLPTEEAHIASKSLGTVDSWTELEYTVHDHGTGLLKGRINRHHADAALLVADRYVLVHSDAGVVGGAFLEEAPIDLSSERGSGDEWMVWGGRGQIVYLDRARMDHSSNITGGHNPIDGYWDLDNQGPLAGDSNAHPIPMMKRALVELQLNSPSGINVVDHSSWTYDTDSASASVPFLDGEAQGADVGDSGLDLIMRFDQLGGVTFEMSPLFELHAYLSRGTDRSGAFASDTVRLEKGVNVAAAIDRKIRGSVNVTHLIVGGADRTFLTTADPDYVFGDVVRWGFLSVPEASDSTQLQAAGQAHIAARKRQTDTWVIPLRDHGDGPANGIYEPGPDGHFWIGDTVSLHTGTGTYDANDEAVPVAAITWQLKTGQEANGDYRVIVEVGSTFNWSPSQAQAGSPGSQHRVLLCQPGTVSDFELIGLLGAACSASGTNPDSDHPAWSGDSEERVEITSAEAVPAGGSMLAQVAFNKVGDADIHPNTVYDERGNAWTKDAEYEYTASAGDNTIQTWRCNVTTAIQVGDYIRFAINQGASLSTSLETGAKCIGVYGYTGSLSSPSVGTGAGGFTSSPSLTMPDGALQVAGIAWWGTTPATITGDGDFSDMVPRTVVGGSSTNGAAVYGQQLLGGGESSWSATFSSTTDWAAIGVGYNTSGSAGSSGDGHPDLVGTSSRVKRCDDTEHYHASADPTVNDDGAHGFRPKTLWFNETNGTTYLLLDNSEGAAVWVLIAANTASGLPIADAGGYFTGTDVEAALQELGAAPSGVEESWDQPRRLELMAHRGDTMSADGYPENTLEAVRQAFVKGVWAEIDVRRTSDGEWYLMHDSTVDRTTDGSGAVSSKTAAQMDALVIDGGYGYSSGRHTSPALHPPSLESVLAMARQHTRRLTIQNNATQNDTNSGELAQLIVDADMEDHVFLVDVNAAPVRAISNRITIGSTDDASEERFIGFVWTDVTSLSDVQSEAPKLVTTYEDFASPASSSADVVQAAWDYGVSHTNVNNLDEAIPRWQELLFGAGATALADLTDDTAITAPSEGDMLRYDGSEWINTPGRWEPVTTNPGSGPELVWDGDEILMTWVDT